MSWASTAAAVRARGRRLPAVLFTSLHGYQRAWAGADLLAALTLLVIAVPEQLATSRLAGMPPITGFYAFIAGTVLFAMLGSNPQLSVGADSTIAPLFAVGVTAMAPSGSTRYIALVAILAVLVGLIVALVGLLRLGWIADFLSAPIISGFLAGVAVIIVVHQVPDLLALPSPKGSTVHRVGQVAGHLDQVNGWALAIGLGVLAVVLVAERLDHRVPGALVALAAATVLVVALHLHSRHGLPVLGRFDHGAPALGLDGLSWSAVGDLLPLAGVVALVVISQSAATTRGFAERGDYDVDVNRDFLGVGAGSIAAGLAGAFPVNASPPRTAAVASASGRTQAAGLGAALAVALLVPAAAVFEDVPPAALAAILIFVAARLFHVRELLEIARFDLVEFGLALITLVTVAFVGVQQGIGVAVALAILDRTRLSARPQMHVLGQIPNTTSWAPLSGADNAEQIPGVLVVLFATPLWYANAVHFGAELDAAIGRALGPPQVIVLDTIGMSDLDYSGTRALSRILDQLDRDGITFALARVGAHVRTSLQRSGLLDRIGPDHVFGSVGEAVAALRRPAGDGG